MRKGGFEPPTHRPLIHCCQHRLEREVNMEGVEGELHDAFFSIALSTELLPHV